MNGKCSKCGMFGCDARAARGMARFCELPIKPYVYPVTYSTRAAAEAAAAAAITRGERVVVVDTGIGCVSGVYAVRAR